ncbi:MAG TPA: porin family protein [Chryseolinea sp.]|nr:porin family protein [Chryseolinea sp.]
MKSPILTFCLLVFCSSSLFSQTAKTPTAEAKTSKILVGPIAGVNYSWSSFGDSDDRSTLNTKPVLGFHVGGHIAFKVRKRFFLHTSILYSSKGRIVESKVDPFLRSKQTYNYIDMPIVYTVDFKGNLGDNKEFKYFLGIGPNVSYWLGGKGNLYNSELNELVMPELDYKIVFKKDETTLKENEMNVSTPNRFQLGLALTAGIEFEPNGLNRIMLNVRYELGHSYLSKTTDGVFANNLNYQEPLQTRNQGFRISLAYLIDLKVEQRKKGKSTIKRSTRR